MLSLSEGGKVLSMFGGGSRTFRFCYRLSNLTVCYQQNSHSLIH